MDKLSVSENDCIARPDQSGSKFHVYGIHVGSENGTNLRVKLGNLNTSSLVPLF